MKSLTTGVTLAAALFASSAFADGRTRYEVTITNITKGQTFTPQLVVGHRASIRLFDLGAEASDELGILAESGNTGPLTGVLLDAGPAVEEVTTIPDALPPRHSASVDIRVPRHNARLSIAAMLVPTNDTFVALNSVRLPRWGSAVYYARAYDAGTELNDQLCEHIPGGGPCAGEPVSAPADTDEGGVYVGNGIHELDTVDEDGIPAIGPLEYDWRNPVARIVVRRIR